MYKWAVRTMVKRNIKRLNQGDLEPALAALHEDAELSFPGTNTWARQFRDPVMGRDRIATHRGKGEIRAFLERYVATGMQMLVEDVLVNGPPWVKGTRGGLLPVPGLGIDSGDHPVRGDFAGDPEYPIVVFVEVLADHGGQQRRRLRHAVGQVAAVQDAQQRYRLGGQRVHQPRPASGSS